MGHLLFLVLHVAAVLFGFVLLVVTIPSHLIYAAIKSNKSKTVKPHPDTHVKCPDCKELVLREARVCKHCGCKLMPQ